jgi:FtsZ-interacting cell division protein YlmF
LTRPIFLNSQFTQFATGPLERIERYTRTGSELTANEQRAEILQREERRAFQESDVYKRARDATWTKQAPPEQVAAAVAALCEEMYKRIAQGDTSMDVGFWTNSLSMTLVKLRRFQEAADWIDRFQSASADLREKTTPSVVAALAKRRLRCAKALGTDT